MIAARRVRVTHTSSGGEPARPWPLLLGLSLLALPAVAAIAASGLLPLWSTIAAKLGATGFWDGATSPGQYDGLVMLPILLALFIPVLVTTAAFFSVGFPLTLLPLLAARSRLFPTLLAMGAICQAALVLTGWIATDAFARLAAMAASGDAEVLRVADELNRATGILTRTAIALVAPLLGMLAWLVFLRPSGAAAAFFTADTSPAPVEALHEAPAESAAAHPWIPIAPVAEKQAVTNLDVAKALPWPGGGTRLAGPALAVVGAVMLAFGAADGLRTRAVYVSSQPAPGATPADPPSTIRVTFRAELDPASSISLTRLIVQPSDGEEPRDSTIARRVAPDDPRTIEAVLSRLSAGVYRVTWQALPAGGGVARHGSFSFGVGAPVPADTTGTTHSLQDRDSGARNRRQIVVGGVLLLVLGALVGLSPHRGG